MGHIYKVTTSNRIDVVDLISELRKERIATYAIDRIPAYQIFEDGYSARGGVKLQKRIVATK